MHENGATTNNRVEVICCEPRVWLENSIFCDGAPCRREPPRRLLG